MGKSLLSDIESILGEVGGIGSVERVANLNEEGLGNNTE